MNIVSRLTHKYVCVQLNLNMHIKYTFIYTDKYITLVWYQFTQC